MVDHATFNTIEEGSPTLTRTMSLDCNQIPHMSLESVCTMEWVGTIVPMMMIERRKLLLTQRREVSYWYCDRISSWMLTALMTCVFFSVYSYQFLVSSLTFSDSNIDTDTRFCIWVRACYTTIVVWRHLLLMLRPSGTPFTMFQPFTLPSLLFPPSLLLPLYSLLFFPLPLSLHLLPSPCVLSSQCSSCHTRSMYCCCLGHTITIKRRSHWIRPEILRWRTRENSVQQ